MTLLVLNKSPVNNVTNFLENYQTKNYVPGAILGIISKAKSKGIDEKQYRELYGEEWDKKNIAIVFEEYEKRLEKQNLVVRMRNAFTPLQS